MACALGHGPPAATAALCPAAARARETARLNPNAAGKIGWYVRVADGRLEVGSGVLPNADFRVTVDYETVLPAVRRLSTDPPLDEAQRQVLTSAITREGEVEMEPLTIMAGLHDVMAVRTQ